MPKGSEKGYQTELTKQASIDQLPTIFYQNPGDYTYKLLLKRKDGTQIGLYYLHVSAYYGEEDRITVTAAIRENQQDGAKTDTIRFSDPAEKKAVTEEKSRVQNPPGHRQRRLPRRKARCRQETAEGRSSGRESSF